MRPIGLFDSGIGGLSIWQELVRCLPYESTVYVADRANCPYGPRPPAEIRCLSINLVRFLLEQHRCKLIVVACNTASAAALTALRTEFDLPFVGLEPAIKPAAAATRTGHIGVLATGGTMQGRLFQNTVRRYANGIHLHRQIGEGLVERVEAGQLDTPETEKLLRRYLEPMLAAGVDQIVLGCTHYPFLWPVMQRIVGSQAQIIDPAPAVARQTERLLNQRRLSADPAGPVHHLFYTTE